MRTLLALLFIVAFGAIVQPAHLGAEDGGDKKKEVKKTKPISYIVVAVDPEKRMMAVKTANEGSETKILKIVDATKLIVEGEERVLTDFKPDMKIKVTMDGEVVTSIEVPKAKTKAKK